MSEPKIYTCNCKTPLYQAAPEMYEFGETTERVLQLFVFYLELNPSELNLEMKYQAEERIAAWQKLKEKVNNNEENGNR